jgi:hypothetical protein
MDQNTKENSNDIFNTHPKINLDSQRLSEDTT